MVRKYVDEFIKYQYKRSDMSMNELTEELIRDYCLYLKNVVGLAQSSIWIYSIPLKHIVTAAHYNGKIPRNPLAMYHADPDHKEREFLPLDEHSFQNIVSTKTQQGMFRVTRNLWLTPKRTCLSVICSSVVGLLRWKEYIKKHKKFLIFLINILDFIVLFKIRNNDRTIEYII